MGVDYCLNILAMGLDTSNKHAGTSTRGKQDLLQVWAVGPTRAARGGALIVQCRLWAAMLCACRCRVFIC